MYSYTKRIGFSETDINKKLSIFSLINEFQDCSIFHSEDCGVGFKYLDEVNRVWLMISWQLEIKRMPSVGDEVIFCTWPYGFKGIYGQRNFCMIDKKSNETLVKANSVWCYADKTSFTPQKILAENVKAYIIEEPLDMTYKDRKISVPQEFKECDKIEVTQSLLDCNKHVNNGQYIRIAENYLPEDFTIQGLRVEYKKMAFLNDIIIPRLTVKDNVYTIVLVDEVGNIYATVEFM